MTNIKVGECYTLSDNIPSKMMLKYMTGYYDKAWVNYLKNRRGEHIKVSRYYERGGIHFVGATGFAYIIPIDCLAEYHDNFNPEEVSFF